MSGRRSAGKRISISRIPPVTTGVNRVSMVPSFPLKSIEKEDWVCHASDIFASSYATSSSSEFLSTISLNIRINGMQFNMKTHEMSASLSSCIAISLFTRARYCQQGQFQFRGRHCEIRVRPASWSSTGPSSPRRNCGSFSA